MKTGSLLTDKLRGVYAHNEGRQGIRFLILGGIVGLVAGVLSLAFRQAIDGVAMLLYGYSPGVPFWETAANLPAWKVFLFPALFGAIAAMIASKYGKNSRGLGVPEIVQAVLTKRGVISRSMALSKIVGTVLSVGSGFAAGRIGPTALLGSVVGSRVGNFLKLPMNRMKMLVGCGAAAGIAATFNAPLAGTAFALEIIVGGFSVHSITPIVLSAMVATVISHAYFGDVHALFSELTFKLIHPAELLSYVGLGLVIGFFAIFFSRTLYFFQDLSEKVKLHAGVCGAIGGLGIGCLLWWLPEITGPATWDAISLSMSGALTWKFAGFFLMIAVLKVIATSWSLASGASGGIFAPCILVGGAVGVSYGVTVNKVFPGYDVAPGGYALVGMGALLAGVTQAPLTAITTVFELTNDYAIVLPLMLSGAVAMGVYNHFVHGSIYSLKLQKRGQYYEMGQDTGILATALIEKITMEERDHVEPSMGLTEILNRFQKSSRSTLPVVDAEERLLGVISLWDIRKIAGSEEAAENQLARDLMKTDVKFVTPKQNLYEAFSYISGYDYEYLPVVENRQSMKLVGKLTRQRLLEAYKNALTMRGIIST